MNIRKPNNQFSKRMFVIFSTLNFVHFIFPDYVMRKFHVTKEDEGRTSTNELEKKKTHDDA